jgi:hypothetical protein
VSVYSEMLRIGLDNDRAGAERPLAELISELLTRRSALMATGPGGSAPSGAADRIGDSLSYDLALARVCGHLAIDHGLTADAPIAVLRERAEQQIAAHLPSIADSLDGDRPDRARSEAASGADPARRPAARGPAARTDAREER